MKKQIKYIIALSLVLITGLSCKKEYLNAPPISTIPDAIAFDTPERILGNIRSLYANTKGGAFYAGRYIVYGDIRGEDFLNETGNLVTGADVWSLNPTGTSTNSVINLWAQAYATINLCNISIEGITAKGPTVVGAPLTSNYLGEARFIRALCYYSLLQFYARPFADGAGSRPGLPLRLTAIKTLGSSDLVRSTVAQVYAQIITDLDSAEVKLPLTYTTAELNTTRAHRNTAIALKTRVYLSMQDYAKVITEGNKIASQVVAPFKATSGVLDSLQPNIATVFSTYNTTESILSFPMSAAAGDNPGTQNQLGFYFVRNATNPGSAEYSLNPVGIVSDSVFSSLTSADARKGLIFTNVVNGKRFVNKYPLPSPFLDYAPVIRYSEVLLNLAEALARTNSATADPKGLALLRAVRLRSNATAATIIPTTQAQLITMILQERRIEFLGEGLRNNDLMRLLQTIPAKGAVPAKLPTDQGYIWPISATEMSLNKLMTDN
jgi:starch-binding outer membrane protein, SusD/RagB family